MTQDDEITEHDNLKTYDPKNIKVVMMRDGVEYEVVGFDVEPYSYSSGDKDE